jgi:hypothetical protein
MQCVVTCAHTSYEYIFKKEETKKLNPSYTNLQCNFQIESIVANWMHYYDSS